MNYYPFHIGDFRSGTVNMTRQSRWIYRDMLDVYYDSEKPLTLDLDVLCDEIGAETDDERKIVERLLRFKFEKGADGYSHSTCERVIADYRQKAETAKANGKLGGRPKKPKADDKEPSGFPSGSEQDATGKPAATGSEANQEPKTNNQKQDSKTKAPPTALPDWMPIESWAGYLEMRKKQKKVPTDRAVELLIGVLGKMREQGHDIAAVLDTSTKNCWTDVYLPKQGDGRSAQPGKFNGLNDIDHTSSRQAMERSVKQMGIPLSNDPTEPPVDF